MPAILLCVAAGSFGVFTISDSYLGGGSASGESDWLLPAARFLVHPLFLAAWLMLPRGRGRRAIVPLDSAALPAVLLSIWFVIGASTAEDPIAGLGRAVPLLLMIWGAFCVVGPSLASPRGTAILFRSAFIVSLLLSSSTVAAVFVGQNPTWGLWGDRFYGPLNATTLGPICVTGLLAALAVWRLTPNRFPRLLIGLAALWLLLLLVMTRARGSYLFVLVAAAAYFGLSSRRTLALRLCGVGALGAIALLMGWNWWRLDVSHSSAAAFLRLDQPDMLAQRSEVWEANASFWMESPLFGVGLGNEATVSELAKRSHSAYLSTLNEGGVPALTLLVLAVVGILARSWKTALHHPVPELRLLGVLAVAIIVGTVALGTVETTLINAASTSNTLVWITAAASVVASRGIPVHVKRPRRRGLGLPYRHVPRLTPGAV